MSHKPLRKEQDCLNCGTIVQGRFCHVCGQENVEVKERFWHLVTHFIYDITHFDHKFFSTVKYLITRPGFLSLEYMRGRRNSYLNPIRMYVFTSAFFFIYFFSVFKTESTVVLDDPPQTATSIRAKLLADQSEYSKLLGDSTLNEYNRQRFAKALEEIESDIAVLERDSTKLDSLVVYKNRFSFMGSRLQMSSVESYDSLQRTLPASEKDGWLKQKFNRKSLELSKKYKGNEVAFWKATGYKFLHSFPQMLFVSLPLFAFLLKLLYARHRSLYYADHGIFTVHIYCAMFIFIFLSMVLGSIADYRYFGWLNYFITPIVTYMAWYLYRSMHNFYQQGWAKTLAKFLLLLFGYFISMLFLFIIFFGWSLFTV